MVVHLIYFSLFCFPIMSSSSASLIGSTGSPQAWLLQSLACILGPTPLCLDRVRITVSHWPTQFSQFSLEHPVVVVGLKLIPLPVSHCTSPTDPKPSDDVVVFSKSFFRSPTFNCFVGVPLPLFITFLKLGDLSNSA